MPGVQEEGRVWGILLTLEIIQNEIRNRAERCGDIPKINWKCISRRRFGHSCLGHLSQDYLKG